MIFLTKYRLDRLSRLSPTKAIASLLTAIVEALTTVAVASAACTQGQSHLQLLDKGSDFLCNDPANTPSAKLFFSFSLFHCRSWWPQ